MRIKYEPEVFVIGQQIFGGTEDPNEYLGQFDKFLQANNLKYPKLNQLKGTEGEQIVEAATRACYLSYGKGRPTDEFFTNIIDSGHGSTLEHATLTLAISGISRSLSHELVRHRHISISQLSQRYVDQTKLAVIMPPGIKKLTEFDQKQWINMAEASLRHYTNTYEHLGLTGIPKMEAREAARSLLPNCVETIVFATANAREWRWFTQLRSSKFADAEMRVLAKTIYHIIKKEWPNIIKSMALNKDGEVSGEHV